MSRIHFEYGDLLRVKLATRRVPLIDLWLMLAAAQRRTSNLLFQQRQRQLRSGVTRDALPLLALAAETGSVPDFLSPPTEDFDTGLQMIRSTPRTVVRRQLEQTFPRESRCPGWIRDLASEGRQSWEMLMQALQRTQRNLLMVEADILGTFHTDLARYSERYCAGGVDGVLDSIPVSRWSGGILHDDEVCGLPRADFKLSGNGVTLVPSATWTGAPLMSATPTGAYVLIVAALPRAAALCGRDPDRLGELIGATRATVLRLLLESHTTTGIARKLHISLASASEHCKVLREAGLITSQRDKSAVRHSRTSLGHSLTYTADR